MNFEQLKELPIVRYGSMAIVLAGVAASIAQTWVFLDELQIQADNRHALVMNEIEDIREKQDVLYSRFEELEGEHRDIKSQISTSHDDMNRAIGTRQGEHNIINLIQHYTKIK